jgi:hypothetical protein
LTISTVSGLPLIHDFSFTLLDPVIVGTGSMSFNFGPLTGLNQSNTFEDFVFLNPVSSFNETLTGSLFTGCGAPSATCTGNALLNGVEFNISLVPEPGSLVLFGTALLALGLMRRRQMG